MSTLTGIDSSAPADLVQRYAVWEARLCEYIATLSRQRTLIYRIFVGGLVVSALGFFFGAWFGIGSLATGITWCGTGLYITILRGHHLEEELELTRAELRRMAAA